MRSKVATGVGYGAIGGAASAALTPFVANAVLDGSTQVSSAQTAIITGLAALTGGVAAGAAGANAQAGATFAENEAQNNCLNHPESCTQMAQNAFSALSNTASNVWGSITNPQPSPSSGFTSATNAGADVPGMESATNLDLLKGIGNVGLNLSSFSLPGMPDYTPVFQYNNPLIGSIGETYGVLGANSLVAGALSSGVATSTGTTAEARTTASASSYVPTAGDFDLENVYSAQVQGAATNTGASGSGGVPPQLLSGQAAESGQLAALNSSGKVTFTPTPDQANSAAFQLIVGQPKYTPSGDLVSTIYDGSTPGGLAELKNGVSPLDSSYQLRLQTYGSLINNTPFTIYTSRSVNSTFSQWLTNWGVSLEPLPK